MYLRFVRTQIDEDSRQPQGVFVAAGTLLKSSTLNAEECEALRQELSWFNKNLPVPDKPYIRGRVIFWYRASAQECIQRMWKLVNLLRTHNYLIEVQKCDHLHNIVYWDAFQVAAIPHKHDGKRTYK